MKNFILVVLVWLFGTSIQSELPSDFPKCKQSDEDFNECLKAAIQDALPKLANGIPDIEFPSFEPIKIPEATVGEGGTGAVRVVQRYKNIVVYNFTHAKIDKVEAIITPTAFKLNISGVAPEFTWESDYELNGQILLLPIFGNGTFHSVAKSITIHTSIIGEKFQKKENTYVKITNVTIILNPERLVFQLNNLFDGNERLSDEMNKVLNENWKEVWADLKSNYEALYETILLNDVNRIFKKIPFDKIFPL